MQLRNFFFKNLGLRLLALFLAVMTWALISGKEGAYSYRTFEVNVEYFGVADKIAIRSVSPDKVRVKVHGVSRELKTIKPEDFTLRVDLGRITETTRLNVFTEDVLEFPPGISVDSIHPKMIEITAAELVEKEVPIRVRYRGKIAPGINLLSRRLQPEKTKILGYKSQIDSVTEVEASEWVNLDEIVESTIIKLKLKKEREILKFIGNAADGVEVHLHVDNTTLKRSANDDKPPKNKP